MPKTTDCSGEKYIKNVSGNHQSKKNDSEIAVIVNPLVKNNKDSYQSSIQTHRSNDSSDKIELMVSDKNTESDEHENIENASRNNIGANIRSEWRKIRSSAHTSVEKPLTEESRNFEHRHQSPQPYHSKPQISVHNFPYPTHHYTVPHKPNFLPKMPLPNTPIITDIYKNPNDIGFRASPIQRQSSPPIPVIMKPSTPPLPPNLGPYISNDPELLAKHILSNKNFKPGVYKIIRPIVKPNAYMQRQMGQFW